MLFAAVVLVGLPVGDVSAKEHKGGDDKGGERRTERPAAEQEAPATGDSTTRTETGSGTDAGTGVQAPTPAGAPAYILMSGFRRSALDVLRQPA